VEVLRHTGIRFEELRELSHHSITQYRLPSTGELVPLLQIAPSKTGAERLLLVSPELADVLSAIVCRIRDRASVIPLVPSYDTHEKTWNPPLPLLFQRAIFGEHRPISDGSLREILQRALAGAGIRGHDAQPLVFTPHDFRRIFVTDAIINGLPPHIAQVICGHRDISTTMGYKAIYPAEAIEAHRAFITRRRQARPSEEYRTPTEEEWTTWCCGSRPATTCFPRFSPGCGTCQHRPDRRAHPRAPAPRPCPRPTSPDPQKPTHPRTRR
jgi:integrase